MKSKNILLLLAGLTLIVNSVLNILEASFINHKYSEFVNIVASFFLLYAAISKNKN